MLRKTFFVFSFVCLFNFLLLPIAFGITDALAESYEVYNPNWSVEANGGSMALNTLAPLKIIEDNQKTGKTPIVLVHGVVSENRPYCNWNFLIEELEKKQNKEFFESHPIYIFRYPTTSNSWAQVSGKLKTGLRELLTDYPTGSKIILVGSSLGGNLICGAVEKDSTIDKSVVKALSLGSPFWGTPLLNKELMLERASSSSWIVNYTISKASNLIFPMLNSQIPWKLPLDGSQGKSTNGCEHLQARFINYGAFIASPMTETVKPNKTQVESWLLHQVQKADYRHAWDSTMHYKMAWEMTRDFKPIYLFKYNDGLVPIYSSLWLDPNKNTFLGENNLNETILRKIKRANPKARLFKGIDHTDLTSKELSKTSYKDLLSNSFTSITSAIVKDLAK